MNLFFPSLFPIYLANFPPLLFLSSFPQIHSLCDFTFNFLLWIIYNRQAKCLFGVVVGALKRMCNDCRWGSALIPFMCETFQISWHHGHQSGGGSNPSDTWQISSSPISPDPLPLIPSVDVYLCAILQSNLGNEHACLIKLWCSVFFSWVGMKLFSAIAHFYPRTFTCVFILMHEVPHSEFSIQ